MCCRQPAAPARRQGKAWRRCPPARRSPVAVVHAGRSGQPRHQFEAASTERKHQSPVHVHYLKAKHTTAATLPVRKSAGRRVQCPVQCTWLLELAVWRWHGICHAEEGHCIVARGHVSSHPVGDSPGPPSAPSVPSPLVTRTQYRHGRARARGGARTGTGTTGGRSGGALGRSP